MKLAIKRPMVVFDIETTGLNTITDRIIELSCLKLIPGGEKVSKTWRVNPTINITEENSMFHGITNEDVKDAPTFGEVAKEILDFLEGCDLAGYNMYRLDLPILTEELYRLGLDLKLDNRKTVDVFKIFQKKEARDLSAAYQFYCKKELENAHSAEADVLATYEVLESQLDRYAGELKNEIDYLSKFTKDGNFIDVGRRLVMDNGVAKFNFGKYKGVAVSEVFKKEPQYYEWIMRNNFLQDTKQKLTALKLKSKFGGNS